MDAKVYPCSIYLLIQLLNELCNSKLVKYFTISQLHQVSKMDNNSLLRLAVQYSSLSAVELLLKCGANVNACNSRRQTPLHLCCLHFDRKIMQKLLKNKAEIYLRCDKGHTPLHLAIINGNLAAVDMMLEYASEFESKEIILPMVWQELLEWKKFPHEDMYILLVKHMKKVDPRFIWELILHRSVRGEQQQRLKTLCDHCDSELNESTPDESHLKTAVSHLLVWVVELFLEKGARAGSQDTNGKTILHEMSEDDKLQSDADYEKCNKIIRSLTKYGCDIERKDSRGKTALHTAYKFRNMPVMRALLENGADINAEDCNGRVPFYDISFYYHLKWWENYSEQHRINKMFTSHVVKLKLIDFSVSDKNKTVSTEIHMSMMYIDVFTNLRRHDTLLEEQCQKELDTMKTTKLMDYPSDNECISVYDFIFGCVDEVLLTVANDDALIKYIESDDFTSKFPLYNFLVHLKLREGIFKRVALNAKQYLVGLGLPDLCSHFILKYLDTCDHYALERSL